MHAQAHQDMDALKSNLRQEHWEVLNWMTKCFEVTTPVQTARFMLGSHPRWCALPLGVCAARARAVTAGHCVHLSACEPLCQLCCA